MKVRRPEKLPNRIQNVYAVRSEGPTRLLRHSKWLLSKQRCNQLFPEVSERKRGGFIEARTRGALLELCELGKREVEDTFRGACIDFSQRVSKS